MAAESDSPKLPPFKSQGDKSRKEEKGPGMPSFLKSPSKGPSPIPRVRGFGGGSSLAERLKSLRKKDLAFIAAGLAVLIMAPLAEHFLMNPVDQGQPVGGSLSGPYLASVPSDNAGGFGPGGPLGRDSEVITPLNVRDPSALVMGPGATQKPSATVEAPAPPSKPDNAAWKDALAAAQRGSSAAAKKASLPMPHPRLQGSMRGFSTMGPGSGGGAYSLPPISSAGVPGRPAGSNALTRAQSAPGYRGVAPRSGSSGGNESMKSAAQKQADLLNKGGSAANALDQAAREAIPGGQGSSFGGHPGGGDENKSPGQGGGKDNKSLGESLAFMRAKEEQSKEIELKWKKKSWNEFERRKMMEEAIIKSALENIMGKGIFEPIGKVLAAGMDGIMPSPATKWVCVDEKGNHVQTWTDEDFKKWKTGGGYAQWATGGKHCFKLTDGTPAEDSNVQSDKSPASVAAVKGSGAAVDQERAEAAIGESNKGKEELGGVISELKAEVAKVNQGACDATCQQLLAKVNAVVSKLEAEKGKLDEASAALSSANGAIKNANAEMKAIQDQQARDLGAEDKAVKTAQAILKDLSPSNTHDAELSQLDQQMADVNNGVKSQEEAIQGKVENPLKTTAQEQIGKARAGLDGAKAIDPSADIEAARGMAQTGGKEGAAQTNLAGVLGQANGAWREAPARVEKSLQTTQQSQNSSIAAKDATRAADKKIAADGASAAALTRTNCDMGVKLKNAQAAAKNKSEDFKTLKAEADAAASAAGDGVKQAEAAYQDAAKKYKDADQAK